MTQAFTTSDATKIAILGRIVSSFEKTKKEVEAAHTSVTVHASVADITDESAVSKAFEGIEKALGKVDILVSNAGYLPDTKPIVECDVEEWFRGMTVNVKGNLILSKAFLKHAAENPTFVHVSTGGCHIPPMPANCAYAVSKMAAAKMAEYLAFENPQVKVHIIHPGAIQTEMYKKSSEGGLDFAFDDSK